ncbi:hypothetical protein GALMADRAFT_1127802 [Galerina marginata CBS 339.88]|uniref:Secreted protein n=1 Tax=Galerina marginata (strain CBS 339.88) TaxID=685588 RepID=A0A067SHU7_GALM3|nr:hypothetical protein GALMADRAFT_1127802 [Galerina marginata CBS 339.88]
MTICLGSAICRCLIVLCRGASKHNGRAKHMGGEADTHWVVDVCFPPSAFMSPRIPPAQSLFFCAKIHRWSLMFKWARRRAGPV